MNIPQERIRNFSIIAHIDHGKSTLADRLLLRTGTITEREFRNQMLDDMDLEQERGITIKAKAVRMIYRADDGLDYQLNLIDTPGHVDFENDLEIIPVLNKIDLVSARPAEVQEELASTFGFRPGESILASAKAGTGTDEILETVVTLVPAPVGDRDAPLRALIIDSHYDTYRGVIVYVCVKEGRLEKGQEVIFMEKGTKYLVDEVGFFSPRMEPVEALESGEVGYLVASIKTIHDISIGDTITTRLGGATEALPGFKNPQPMVFCGIYPSDNGDFESLRNALEKLWLNDSSFTFQPETSEALGFGFR